MPEVIDTQESAGTVRTSTTPRTTSTSTPPLYYLAWQDRDGGSYDSTTEYLALGEAVERGQEAQRGIEARGNLVGRRYEVRERVYGWVVWRALVRKGE